MNPEVRLSGLLEGNGGSSIWIGTSSSALSRSNSISKRNQNFLIRLNVLIKKKKKRQCHSSLLWVTVINTYTERTQPQHVCEQTEHYVQTFSTKHTRRFPEQSKQHGPQMQSRGRDGLLCFWIKNYLEESQQAKEQKWVMKFSLTESSGHRPEHSTVNTFPFWFRCHLPT